SSWCRFRPAPVLHQATVRGPAELSVPKAQAPNFRVPTSSRRPVGSLPVRRTPESSQTRFAAPTDESPVLVRVPQVWLAQPGSGTERPIAQLAHPAVVHTQVGFGAPAPMSASSVLRLALRRT